MDMSKILLAVAALLLTAGGFYARHMNAQTAAKQVAALVAADTAGTDTKAGAATLKDYVSTHMGASVDVNLTAGYQRAVAASQAAPPPPPNAALYAEAQKACAGRTDSITQARCVQAFVAPRLVAEPAATPVPLAPKVTDYSYRLAAPWWAPDVAGALFLGAVLALLALFGRLAHKRWIAR